jgi:hypothetical protein
MLASASMNTADRFDPDLRAYRWNAPIKSVADLVAPDDTTAVGGPDTRSTERRSVGRDSSRGGEIRTAWLARHLDIASHLHVIGDALTRSTDAGMWAPPIVALRRASGGLAVIRDCLYRVQRELDLGAALSPDSPPVRYVDCVYWWLAQLSASLEGALARVDDVDDATHAVLAAAEFAALYALSHVGELFADCETMEDGRLAQACAQLHANVMWMTWQLKDLVEV